jgi:predicted metalloprotease with PDZ domain
VQRDIPTLAATLGLRLSEGPVSGVTVRHVLRGSAAETAGVLPGDELLAIDGWRLRRFDDARAWLVPGQSCELLLVRDQRLRGLRVLPPSQPAVAGVALRPDPQAAPAALARRRAWLGV